jgi:hypothetical protein
MNHSRILLAALATVLASTGATNASAALVITEVDSSGSSNASPLITGYNADWFELTNTGSSAINLSGWRMDDNSNSFASGVTLHDSSGSGVVIGAGQSIVFMEDNSTGTNGTTFGTNDATLRTNFVNAWFGGNAPAGLTFGFYGGSGVGLGQSGDAVNLFNSTGTLIANVSFGAPSGTATFDNTVGLTGAISTASVNGLNGAFASAAGEIGSPGNVSPVPLPAAAWLLTSGLGALGAFRRRRKAA